MRNPLRSLTARLHPGTYSVGRAPLIPLDVAMSLLAKRSYMLYRAWTAYMDATAGLFEPAEPALDDEERVRLEQLQRDGVTAWPGGYPRAEVDAAREWVLGRWRMAKARAGELDPTGTRPEVTFSEGGVDYAILLPEGRTRMHFREAALAASDLPSLIRRFADDPPQRRLIGAYFHTSLLSAGLPYYMAEVMERTEKLESWHFDCVRPTIKTFLTLSDVGDAQAPLRYVPGSHIPDEAKHRLNFAVFRGGLGNAYFDAAACARHDAAARSMTAPANTVIAFDTRGVHAGSHLTEGLRVTLATGYRPAAGTRINPRLFPDPETSPYPWERAEGT